MAQKFTLTVAPNGARKTKRDHPGLPTSARELATAAQACYAAGADCLHLHVRDDAGRHSLDVARYQEAMAAVAEAAPLMSVQITTESGGIFDVAQQFACLRGVVPKAASISLGEMMRDRAVAERIYQFAHEAGIAVQHILYTPDEVGQLADWMAQGAIPAAQNSVLFVLGKYQPETIAQPEDLDGFLQAAKPYDLEWTVCAFGPSEQACLNAAMLRGGNIRVGFENNIHLPDGRRARDNAELVAVAYDHARRLGRVEQLAKGA